DGTEPPVQSVVIDSRQVQPGALFIAFEGEQLDGHDFVTEALDDGAVAVMVERPVVDGILTVDTRDGADGQELSELTVSQPLQIVVEDSEQGLQQLARYWRNQFDVQVIGITGSVGKTSTKELTYAVLSRRFRTLKSEGNYNNEIGLPLTLMNLRPYHQQVVLEM